MARDEPRPGAVRLRLIAGGALPRQERTHPCPGCATPLRDEEWRCSRCTAFQRARLRRDGPPDVPPLA